MIFCYIQCLQLSTSTTVRMGVRMKEGMCERNREKGMCEGDREKGPKRQNLELQWR